ncbi:hypothetical protein [Streptomyces sp. NPDC059786]|uniref:hypothetical protein n=1 Tax=Streptomyces sp. NPDC059786 TaxID=3346946 RepID=UPI003666CFC9
MARTLPSRPSIHGTDCMYGVSTVGWQSAGRVPLRVRTTEFFILHGVRLAAEAGGRGDGDAGHAGDMNHAGHAGGMGDDVPAEEELSLPKALEDRTRSGPRRSGPPRDGARRSGARRSGTRHGRTRLGRVRGAVLFALSTVLAAAALPTAAGTATAAPGTDLSPLPWPTAWPTLTWPRETEPSATPAPGPSPAPDPDGTDDRSEENEQEREAPPQDEAGGKDEAGGGAEAPQVTLPCLTGVDTGGLPNPEEAEPGELPEDPGDLTALRPPVVVGDQPGRPRATYQVNTVYPDVGADSLTAYGAVVHGATYLKTAGGGRLEVLWVHADRLVADDYAFRLETRGQAQTIGVDLDIPQVDIYVTQLTGSITIPYIGVGTPRICIGADVVPANLPIAVQLPELSVTAVEAGQVLVDAETVGFSGLSAHSRPR